MILPLCVCITRPKTSTGTNCKVVQWFTGNVLLFRPADGGPNYYIHENLLNAKCSSSKFRFQNAEEGQTRTHLLWYDDQAGFIHFLLWINCDMLAPLGDDPERSYLSAFRFAQVYGLAEFEEFVSSRFAEFIPSHYGGAGGTTEPHNPSLESLVYAWHCLRKDSAAHQFIVEQFVRSWIWRQAYNSKELDSLVDKYPDLVKALFRRTQDVVKKSHEKSLAIFRSPMGDMDCDEASETVVTQTEAADADGFECEVQPVFDSQASSDGKSTAPTDDFEVVWEGLACEEAQSEPAAVAEPAPVEEEAKCEPEPAVEAEAYPSSPYEESEPAVEAAYTSSWGIGFNEEPAAEIVDCPPDEAPQSETASELKQKAVPEAVDEPLEDDLWGFRASAMTRMKKKKTKVTSRGE